MYVLGGKLACLARGALSGGLSSVLESPVLIFFSLKICKEIMTIARWSLNPHTNGPSVTPNTKDLRKNLSTKTWTYMSLAMVAG